MNNEKAIITGGLATLIVAIVGVFVWNYYLSPAATLDRAESREDVSRLLELAGKSTLELSWRIDAMQTAFELMEERKIQSPDLDAQISDVRRKFEGGLREHRYKSGGRGWEYANSDFQRRLKDLNRSYVKAIGLQLIEEIEHHLVPRRRPGELPESIPKQSVDLVLRLWRDPETDVLRLSAPGHLQNHVGLRNSLWYGSPTRSEIDSYLAGARRLGIEVLSLTKAGTYRPEPATSYLPPRDCGSQRPFSGKAFQQVFDLYVVDLKEDRVLSSFVGLVGGPAPTSTKKCYGVGKRPNGAYSSFFSTSD